MRLIKSCPYNSSFFFKKKLFVVCFDLCLPELRNAGFKEFRKDGKRSSFSGPKNRQQLLS